MNPNAFDLMLSRFPNSREHKPMKEDVARQARARCPVHQRPDSKGRSLSFGVGVDGTPLVNCFNPSCVPADVLAAVGLDWPTLFGSHSHGHCRKPITGWVGVMAGLDELNDAGFNLTFTNPLNQNALFEVHHEFCCVLNKLNELVKTEIKKGRAK